MLHAHPRPQGQGYPVNHVLALTRKSSMFYFKGFRKVQSYSVFGKKRMGYTWQIVLTATTLNSGLGGKLEVTSKYQDWCLVHDTKSQ